MALNQTEQASSTSTNTISQGNCVARSQLGSLLLANNQTSFTTKSETQNQELPRHQDVRKVRKCFSYILLFLTPVLLLGGEDIGYQRDHSEKLAFAYAVSHQPFFPRNLVS